MDRSVRIHREGHATFGVPDGAGGVFLGGSSEGSLGGSNAGLDDAWVARYDGAGNLLWLRQLGTSSYDFADAAATDGTGGVFVGGHTHGSLGGPGAGGYDAWLARYDGAGSLLWIRQLGTSGFDDLVAAAPDGAGGVFVGGGTEGSLGGGSLGGTDAWLARYDGAGNQSWIRQLGTSDHESIRVATADGTGGAFLGGPSRGSFGGPPQGGVDTWLGRYDSLGNQVWITRLGTMMDDYPHAAGSDGSGGVYFGGSNGLLPFGGWLARYDTAGNLLWTRLFQGGAS